MAPRTALSVNICPGVDGMGAESNWIDCDKATTIVNCKGNPLIKCISQDLI